MIEPHKLAAAGGQYIPTTDEVRISTVADLSSDDPLYAERLAQFDRWLAGIRAQVLSEAADAMPHPAFYYTQTWDGEDVRYCGWEDRPRDLTPATWLRARSIQEAQRG